jgi:hypothetical protein
MQRTTLSATFLGFLLFCCGGILLASDADELRERANALRKKAEVVAEQGNKDRAERLEQESMELMEAAERMELKAKGRGDKGDRSGIDMKVQRLKERLQDLLAKDRRMREANAPEQELAVVREQISGTKGELFEQIHAHFEQGELHPEFRAQAEKLEVASRHIHHLRVAAENLKLAEEHELAHKLMEKVEAMEQDVQQAKKRLVVEMHEAYERQGDEGPDVVRELRAEIDRLRAEVKELSRKVERR